MKWIKINWCEKYQLWKKMDPLITNILLPIFPRYNSSWFILSEHSGIFCLQLLVSRPILSNYQIEYKLDRLFTYSHNKKKITLSITNKERRSIQDLHALQHCAIPNLSYARPFLKKSSFVQNIILPWICIWPNIQISTN